VFGIVSIRLVLPSGVCAVSLGWFALQKIINLLFLACRGYVPFNRPLGYEDDVGPCSMAVNFLFSWTSCDPAARGRACLSMLLVFSAEKLKAEINS
jgi:hypothetical protein